MAFRAFRDLVYFARRRLIDGPSVAARHVIAVGFFVLLAPSAQAEVSPAAGIASGQETVVTANGSLREISGGGRPASSANVFYRFSEFDTRNGVSGVKFLNDAGRTNVIAGVSSPAFISVPVELQNRGNLYLLSPLGIQVLSGATFVGVDTLMLTTSRRLALAGGVFDALATTDFSSLAGAPPVEVAGLLSSGLGEGSVGDNFTDSDTGGGGIQIANGVSLSVDKSLLIASNARPIEINSASLSAAGAVAGDALSVVGQNIEIADSVLKSNALIEIREPIRVDAPAVGTLASPTVQSIGCTAPDACAYLSGRADTWSYLKMTDVVLEDAGSPASAWKVILKVTGWGCRDNGSACPDNAQALVSPNPGFPQIGVMSPGPSNPGRRAYRGLDVSNVVIKPGSGVADLDVTIALDWGAIANLEVLSPSTVTSRAVRFQAANGSGIAPGANLVVAYAESLGLVSADVDDLDEDGNRTEILDVNDLDADGITAETLTAAELRSADARVETYALGWSLGKISDLTDSANAKVSYSGVWYDGGDATFNNITISYLGGSSGGGGSPPPPVVVTPTAPSPAPAPVPAPAAPAPAPVPATVPVPVPPQASNPAPSPAVTAATAASFDQVLFNFDQTVFSDADATAGIGAAATPSGPGKSAVPPGVNLNVSLDAPAMAPGAAEATTPATDQAPVGSDPNASGSDADQEKEKDAQQSDQPAPGNQSTQSTPPQAP